MLPSLQGLLGAEWKNSCDDTNAEDQVHWFSEWWQKWQMTQEDRKGGDVYMNPFVGLCEPESRVLKKLEVPEILFPVGESDLLF